MRDTLLQELAEIDGVELLTAHDYRLPALMAATSVPVSPEEDVWQIWGSLIAHADAAWVVAPESTGLLHRLTGMVEAEGKRLLGCSSAAVELAGSKFDTFQALTAAGVACVPSWRADVWMRQQAMGESWVAKPDDGVSCEDSCCLNDVEALRGWLRGREHTHVVQPWRNGAAASLSMLCRDGRAWLLSCNRQLVRRDGNEFRYEGSVINGLAQYRDAFARLAADVACAMPALRGYVGVDLMMVDDDPSRLEVLEINPRLTTSYAGLHEATGINVAKSVIELMEVQDPATFRMPSLCEKIVEITL